MQTVTVGDLYTIIAKQEVAIFQFERELNLTRSRLAQVLKEKEELEKELAEQRLEEERFEGKKPEGEKKPEEKPLKEEKKD